MLTSRLFFLPFLLFLNVFSAQAQWVQASSGTAADLYDLAALPGQSALFAVGEEGALLYSSDAGEAWSNLTPPDDGALYAVHFIDEEKGFVGGEAGLFRTNTLGLSWSPVPLPAQPQIWDIHFVDASVGFCVGSDGAIFKTTDGGETWALKPSGTEQNLARIQFPTPQVGYITPKGYSWAILKTTDGGETWNTLPIQPIEGLSNLDALYFTDANTGYLGGWYLSAFMKTENGGQTWSDMSENQTEQVYSIDFVNESIGYAVGWNGMLQRTDDAGTTWQALNMPVGDEYVFYKVLFVNAQRGFVAGSNGLILRTENGGLVNTNGGISAPTQRVSLSPNPAHANIQLRSFGAPMTSIVLTDAMGRVVLTRQSAGVYHWPLEVGTLGTGLYHYQVRTADGSAQSGKLVLH
jgi:photosystem II stability/assembly factor-like uncharacterized protein